MDPNVLDKVIFPLQDLRKDEVRKIAQEQVFPNADKKDSTGICFIGDIDYGEFVKQYIPDSKGDIVTKGGKIVGEHNGLHLFTRGQRKGIDIGGTGPYYVLNKNLDTNELIVTNNSDDPDLYQSGCTVSDMHWLYAMNVPAQVSVQVRYRQTAVPATVDREGDLLRIIFDEPQRAVTPGQSAVLYSGNCVVGGGIIEETFS